MSDYLKLDKPPQFVLCFPQCSACEVDLENDERWTCPSCGTEWSDTANDGDEGKLYKPWDGSELPGPTLTHDEAAEIAHERQRAESEAFWARYQRNAGGAA